LSNQFGLGKENERSQNRRILLSRTQRFSAPKLGADAKWKLISIPDFIRNLLSHIRLKSMGCLVMKFGTPRAIQGSSKRNLVRGEKST
jgi:hypothetical protein